jgi:hypothetical protein
VDKYIPWLSTDVEKVKEEIKKITRQRTSVDARTLMTVCTGKELNAEFKRLNEALGRNDKIPRGTKQVLAKALAATCMKAFEENPLLPTQVLVDVPEPKLETTYEERRSLLQHNFFGLAVQHYGPRYTEPIVLPEKYL